MKYLFLLHSVLVSCKILFTRSEQFKSIILIIYLSIIPQYIKYIYHQANSPLHLKKVSLNKNSQSSSQIDFQVQKELESALNPKECTQKVINMMIVAIGLLLLPALQDLRTFSFIEILVLILHIQKLTIFDAIYSFPLSFTHYMPVNNIS